MAPRRGIPIALRAFRQAEQVVGLLSVVLRLEVFVTQTGGHDDAGRFTTGTHKEGKFLAFNTGDCLGLRHLPTLVAVDPADVFNTIMRVLAVRFVDALDL